MDQTLLRSQETEGSGKVILSKFEVSLGYIRKRIIIRERKTNKQKHKGPEFPDWKIKSTWFSTRSSAVFSNHCRVSFCCVQGVSQLLSYNSYSEILKLIFKCLWLNV